MNTTSIYSSNDSYSSADFTMTIAVAIIGGAVVFGLNLVPAVGVILSFVALMLLGFVFARMPARLWGDLFIFGATLAGFFMAIQFRFQADWDIALLFTFVATFSLFWGFWEGMKPLSEIEKQGIYKVTESIVEALIFSAVSATVMCGATRISYIGIIFGILLAFALGRCLAWLDLPIWSYVAITILSFVGFFLGMKWQFEEVSASRAGAILGTCIGAIFFFYGFFRTSFKGKSKPKIVT